MGCLVVLGILFWPITAIGLFLFGIYQIINQSLILISKKRKRNVRNRDLARIHKIAKEAYEAYMSRRVAP